eukprot:3196145-Alexandrium_andersonii.AAC.1
MRLRGAAKVQLPVIAGTAHHAALVHLRGAVSTQRALRLEAGRSACVRPPGVADARAPLTPAKVRRAAR